MPVPSLYPILMKSVAEGNIVAAGTQYIENFDVEVLEMIEVEILDETITVEIIETIDVEVADETIEVEIT